jgi:hypothetical protein
MAMHEAKPEDRIMPTAPTTPKTNPSGIRIAKSSNMAAATIDSSIYQIIMIPSRVYNASADPRADAVKDFAKLISVNFYGLNIRFLLFNGSASRFFYYIK